MRWLFLDLNSYFASVEQAEKPELRDKPIAVAPVFGDGATIIAASYPAKAFGVKTGTKVGDARRMCPDIIFVQASHTMYLHYHNRILEAVESVLPIDKVCSIDEMRFQLLGKEKEPSEAMAIAKRMKLAIAEQVSPQLTASIGVAPNAFLAKLATEFQKPDGLVVIQGHELPERLDGLDLKEFPGINKRTEARLMAAGIFTSDDLVRRSPDQLKVAFGSKIGERWFYLLRGHELDFDADSRKSLGHSHVLSPELRNDEGARSVLLRLIHKACARLRGSHLWAEHVDISVSGFKTSWSAGSSLPPTQDALTVQSRALALWEHRTFDKPVKVGITFTKVKEDDEVTFSIFDETKTGAQLGDAVDTVNHKFGKNSVFLASLAKAKDHASEKIAFNKTWLMSEGKGDNEWVNTFQAPTKKKKDSDP